ncbi:MAG TPA: hypothetical protein VHV26_06760 [Rhizomicrobium sp.]|nr:hypothetical protein [Rhizomicrobium sp.]
MRNALFESARGSRTSAIAGAGSGHLRPLSLLLARLAALAARGSAEAGDPTLDAEPLLDAVRFRKRQSAISDSSFCYFVSRYLLDAEFHLEEIARTGAAKDFPRAAHNARVLAGMAADLGAVQTAAAAYRVVQMCRRGNYRGASRQIADLRRSCAETEMALRGLFTGRLSA